MSENGRPISDPVAAPANGSAPVLIGLTGPIGCGKSTVSAMLGELGGVVVDADTLVRAVTAPGEPVLATIRDRFGDTVFDPSGVLDRGTLASVVFSDAAALRDLEAILHPLVRARVEAAIAAARTNGDPFVVVEAIKLVEGGLAQRCDEVWLVVCSADQQRQRLVARGMGAADIDRRIAIQGADLAERLAAHADRRIDNSASLESLRECVENALAEVLAPRFAGLPWGPVERR